MAFDDYVKTNKNDFFSLEGGKRTTWTAPGFSPVSQNWSESRMRPSVDTFTGKKNPAYRQQIRDVLSATTPAFGTKTSYSIEKHPLCGLRWVYKQGNPTQESRGEQSHFGFDRDLVVGLEHNLSDSQVLASVENRSIAKLYSDLNGFASSAKMGEDFGEIRQTRDALRRPLPMLSSLLKSTFEGGMKALRRGGPKAIARAAADTWLQFQFGMLPLAKNIADATIGLRNRDVMFNYRPFHATDFGVAGSSTSNQTVLFGGNIIADAIVKRSVRYEVIYQGVWAEEVNVPQRPVENILGLNARDVLPTIWNLVPWSFLVDYAVNIGDILGAIAVPWGGVRWCNKTVRTLLISEGHQVYRQNFTSGSLPDTRILYWNPQTGIIHRLRSSFVRSAVVTKPLPSLELSSPLDWSWKRYANLASLATLMGGRFNKALKKQVARHPELPAHYLQELARRDTGNRSRYLDLLKSYG